MAFVVANTSGGTGSRTLQSVTSTNGDYVLISGSDILFATTGNATRVLNYTVADASSPTAFTASSTLTVSVTNAIGLVNSISASGSGVTISLAGVPGYKYAVERSPNANSGPWTLITGSETNAPAAGIWSFTDPSPPNPSFYRNRQSN